MLLDCCRLVVLNVSLQYLSNVVKDCLGVHFLVSAVSGEAVLSVSVVLYAG